MMDEGYYCEVMGWTIAFYGAPIQIIQTDASLLLTPDMQTKFDECMSQFTFDRVVSWKTRIEAAKVIFREVFMLVDEIITCNPAIFD